MKELRNVVSAYKENPEISIDELIEIFGIRSHVNREYIKKLTEVCSEYFPFITQQSIFVIGYILNDSTYDVKAGAKEELYQLRRDTMDFYLSRIKSLHSISKEQVSEIKRKQKEYELLYMNGYNREHELLMDIYEGLSDCIDDCFLLLSVFNVKNFTRYFFRKFGASYILERYLVKNDLYTYSQEDGELRLSRGSVVACCIPVDNLPDNLIVGEKIKVLNPRNKKELVITIKKQHGECKFTYLVFDEVKEFYISNSREVDDAYDALFDVNRFIFAGNNWRRRLLIYLNKQD